jgi:hypothetical protein
MSVAGSCDYIGFYGIPKVMLLDGVFMERRHFRNAGIAIDGAWCYPAHATMRRTRRCDLLSLPQSSK